MQIKNLFLIFAVFCLLLFSSGMVAFPASAQQAPPTIFVSSSGSDTTGTGSITAPYSTVSHAVAMAPNGAIINIEPGTYDDFVNVTKSLTLESTSGQPSNTIINAAGKSFGIWIRGIGANGTTIDGLTVENANSHGIYAEDTSHILLENNHVLHNTLNPFPACPTGKPPTGPCVETQVGIEFDGVSYSTVASNTVSETLGDGGIAVHSDSTKLNPGALTPSENSSAIGNVVVGNAVIGNQGGCGIVISSFDAGFLVSDTIVSDNTVIGNVAGVIIATNGPFQTVTNTAVTDNQLLNNFAGPGVDIFNVAGTISGTTISDNTIAGNAPPSFTNHPTGIGAKIIAIPHLPPPVTSGTTISGNTIRDEYYGIYFANTTVGTTVLQNSIDSSVNVPLTGVSLTSTPSSVTTINSVTTVQQGTTVIQTADTTTPSILGIVGIVIACIGVGIGVVALRRKSKS